MKIIILKYLSFVQVQEKQKQKTKTKNKNKKQTSGIKYPILK